MNTFRCHACGKQSRYLDHHTEMFIEMAVVKPDRKRTRTYRCEFCQGDNDIDHTDREWLIIDAELDGTGAEGPKPAGGGV